MRRGFVLAIAVAAASCQASAPRFAGGALSPIAIEGDRVLVTAHIDGKPRVMVIDTAASITSLSTTAARELGISFDGFTRINDTVHAGLGTVKSLSVGLADHANVQVAIVDMPNARDSAVKFDGILGLDILGNHDVVLDFKRRTLALYPAGAIVQNRLMPGMARVDLQRGSYGLMTLDVQIGNKAPPIRAILDLGAPTTVINRAAAYMLDVRKPIFRPRSIAVGGVDLARRAMVVRDLPVFARFGLANRPALLLGSDVFQDRSLVIGFRDRVAMLSSDTQPARF